MKGNGKKLLEIEDLQKHFRSRSGWSFGHSKRRVVKAVDGVSFAVGAGETLAIVGESGCGKSTTCRAILRLDPPTSGRVLWQGEDVWEMKSAELRRFKTNVQAVFQDPWGSLNPRMRLVDSVTEPLFVGGMISPKERKENARLLLEQVALPREFSDRFPHELSGGQRQRVAIARALSTNPQLIVLDEPVSSLDVSVRAQVMNLLKELQEEKFASYLLVAHHMATVRYLSDKVIVMYLGKVVEEAGVDDLFDMPRHPYTRALLDAALPATPRQSLQTPTILGDPPSPTDIPPGCPYNPRCPLAEDICRVKEPALLTISAGHKVACHLAEKLTNVDRQR